MKINKIYPKPLSKLSIMNPIHKNTIYQTMYIALILLIQLIIVKMNFFTRILIKYNNYIFS